jgi:ribonuclease P/MRP protein subunit POP5
MRSRPPTLRNKRRYLLIAINPEGFEPDAKQLYLSIHEAVSSLYGDYMGAGIQMAVITCEGGYAVIRCRRGSEHLLATALITVTGINNDRATLRTVVVSGTIHGLKKRIRFHQYPEEGNAAVEISVDGRCFVPVYRNGQKVNLIEKGFKNHELLFLTEKDFEDI